MQSPGYIVERNPPKNDLGRISIFFGFGVVFESLLPRFIQSFESNSFIHFLRFFPLFTINEWVTEFYRVFFPLAPGLLSFLKRNFMSFFLMGADSLTTSTINVFFGEVGGGAGEGTVSLH